MKPYFVALLLLGVLPMRTSAQEVNFDDLRRAGTPLVKSYTISGVGAEGSNAVMKFGDIDTRRVEEHNAQRRAYAASGGGGVSTSTSGTGSGSSSSGGTAKSSSPSRGVERISDNGKLSGVPSHLVRCRSGGTHAVYYKNGTWYHGVLMGMGSKFDSWSVGQLGDYLCK